MSGTAQHATTARNGEGNGSVGAVSFSDLARAHYAWDSGAGGLDGPARQEFEEKLEQFERSSSSKVVEAYWCRKEASAIALARVSDSAGRLQRGWRLLTRRQDVPDFRLYRETDWLTVECRDLADLLHECDVLAIKAVYGLEGFQRALVLQWLVKVEAHVLGYIEWGQTPQGKRANRARLWSHLALPTSNGGSSRVLGRAQQDAQKRPAVARVDHARRLIRWGRRRQQNELARQLGAFYSRTLRELSKIEDYYQQAGQKRARLRYVEGMLVFGLVGLAIAGVASAAILALFGLLDLHEPGVRRFYACMAAGAIGAVVSVLIRMSGRGGGFTIDHELGSVGVKRLGAFRPLVGAVFGVVISFLVQTSLVPISKDSLSIEFFVVVAFLAGFSERWTKVVLAGAMRTIASDGHEQGKPQTTAPVAALSGSTAIARD